MLVNTFSSIILQALNEGITDMATVNGTIAQHNTTETGTLPSAQIFAECQILGTRQRPPLPSVALGETWHSANRALPSVWHSAK